MSLSGEDREALMEARDLARETKVLVERVIVPALKENKKDHMAMGARVDELETAYDQLRGAYKAMAITGGLLTLIIAFVGVVVAF